MQFTKLNSDRTVNINVFKYKIDFNNIQGSGPEVAVKTFLKRFWSKDLVLDEFIIPGSRLRVDIININKKIAIEVSPASTHSFNKFFHGNISVFASRLKKEISKQDWCIKNGFTYIELGDDEIENLTKQMFKEKYDVNL